MDGGKTLKNKKRKRKGESCDAERKGPRKSLKPMKKISRVDGAWRLLLVGLSFFLSAGCVVYSIEQLRRREEGRGKRGVIGDEPTDARVGIPKYKSFSRNLNAFL